MTTHRRLGRSDLMVSPLCFGGNVFGWTADQATSFALLDRLVEAGLNFVDTADGYSRWAPGNSGGESETIIGDWLKARGARDRVVIATKVGAEMAPDAKGLSARWITAAVEDSLRRLQTDHIDLYQAHFDDPDTPIDETLGAFDALVKAGKVRWIGASNFTPERLAQSLAVSDANGLARYQSLQPHYNLYDRDKFEGPLQTLCVKEGLGVIPYYSLASGFLTGKYRSKDDFGKSARGGGMAKFLDERGLEILAALDEVAAGHAATPAQVALAWLMARPAVTAPIASATSVEQLDDLIASTLLVLPAADMARLEQAGAG